MAVLAVGSVLLLVTLLREEDPPGPVPAQPTFTSQQTAVSQVEPEARKVAGKFILTAVARKNIDQSWAITHPDMRAGFTRREWARGDLPVVPYEVSSISEARFRVDALEKNMVQLDVALLPKEATPATKAGVFKIGLVAVGTGDNRRWLVDYWGPAELPTARARGPAPHGGQPRLGLTAVRSAHAGDTCESEPRVEA